MAYLQWKVICIDIPKVQLKFAQLLTSFRRLVEDASRSLFLINWKQVDKENVVSVENFMIPEILKIHAEGFQYKNEKDIIRYSKMLKKTFYVIKSQDKPVGYCIYYIKPVLSPGRFKKKAVIRSIAIDKNFRNRGLAKSC
jgi:ribosomal-protein-alanine N-acetyltransferase